MTPDDELTVVIPAFNEEEALPHLIKETYDALEGIARLELIIIDDGSSDRTAEVMSTLQCPEDRQQVERGGAPQRIYLPQNQGMGAALKAGFSMATCAWVTFIPGDGQIAPSQIPLLFSAVQGSSEEEGAHGASIVTTRYTNREYSLKRKVLSRGMRILSALIVGTSVHSEGMYLLHRDLLQRLPLHSDSFMLNLEIPIRVVRASLPTAIAHIEVRPRQGGLSSATRFGRIFQTLRDMFMLRLQLERERGLLKHLAVPLIKLMAVIIAVGWAASNGLLERCIQATGALSFTTFSIACGWMTAGLLLGVGRWVLLLRASTLPRPPLLTACRLYYEGLFYNTFAPGAVGGDLLRAHWLRAQDPSSSTLHYLITLGERGLGVLCFGILWVGSEWGLDVGFIALGGLITAVWTLPLLSRRFRARIESTLKTEAHVGLTSKALSTFADLSALNPVWVTSAIAVNFCGHLAGFAVFITLASDLGITLTPVAWIACLSLAQFAANLPISVAGIGPREVALVATLGGYGVSEADALALSLSGLAVLVSHALVGGGVHLTKKKEIISFIHRGDHGR